MSDDFSVNRGQLTQWAASLLQINHHGVVIQRELKAGNVEQAADLAERARLRAWRILNELFECGAERPEGYRESGMGPDSARTEDGMNDESSLPEKRDA
jgi:hypothetical protein